MFTHYITLKANQHYEILNEYPYYIREVETHKVPFSYYDIDGYIYVELDNVSYPFHQLIAEQFIPNPNNYTLAIMRSEDVRDVHLNNIFWVSNTSSKKLKEKQQTATNNFLYEVVKSDIEYHNVLNEAKNSLISFDFMNEGSDEERAELIKQLKAKLEAYHDEYIKRRFTIIGEPTIKYSPELGYKVIAQHDKLMDEFAQSHK